MSHFVQSPLKSPTLMHFTSVGIACSLQFRNKTQHRLLNDICQSLCSIENFDSHIWIGNIQVSILILK